MRIIDESNVEDIALGAAVMGTGGGGDPYVGMLMAKQAIRDYGPVKLYDLDDLDDDDLVIPTAMMGAPTVMVEKLPNGDDFVLAFETVSQYIGKPVKATMTIEAGGLNSVVPIYVAARLGVPMVDCDGMGRAYPELQQVTHTMYGISSTPIAMADDKGNVVLMETVSNSWTETFARSVTVNMGAMASIALYAATVGQLKEAAILRTVTQAEEIGKVIRRARLEEADPVKTVIDAVNGVEVFRGKVGDVERRTEGGFARGTANLTGVDGYSGQSLQLQFQNEHLALQIDGEYRVTTPDLIAVLDIDTGEPITTEGLRYGYRAVVVAMPCSPKWRTPEGLELVGPRYFGYDTDYVPLEERYPNA
jgi:DUF917 family protein